MLLAVVFAMAGDADENVSRTITVTPKQTLTLVRVPAGEFVMGDQTGRGQKDERPTRLLKVPALWVMQTEVTVGMFQEYTNDTGAEFSDGCGIYKGRWINEPTLRWDSPGFEQDAAHPVTCVSWADTQGFIRWINTKTEQRFRLPSEAEWEYFAKAGSGSDYFFGSDRSLLCQYANGADQRALQDYPSFSVNECDDGFVRTAPVGSFKPNPWGLFDVTGNVWEWVEDCWQPDYDPNLEDARPVIAEGCDRRAYRGGAYGDIPGFLRISLRNRGGANERRDDIGFRLVMDSN